MADERSVCVWSVSAKTEADGGRTLSRQTPARDAPQPCGALTATTPPSCVVPLVLTAVSATARARGVTGRLRPMGVDGGVGGWRVGSRRSVVLSRAGRLASAAEGPASRGDEAKPAPGMWTNEKIRRFAAPRRDCFARAPAEKTRLMTTNSLLQPLILKILRAGPAYICTQYTRITRRRWLRGRQPGRRGGGSARR